jgi:hypothetical protein
MATRSAAAASASGSSSMLKRRSAAAASAGSPAKRRSTRGGGASASAATVADPPTLVPAAPPAGSGWCLAMKSGRDAGEFLDITLLVGDRQIQAHRNVLAGLSPYIHGLLTSGLAESKQGGDEMKIGDEHTDGRAVEAIVDCFYSGELSISRGTASSMIRTANLLGVDAVEKAACDFFVESIEPSTACEAVRRSPSPLHTARAASTREGCRRGAWNMWSSTSPSAASSRRSWSCLARRSQR